MKSGSRGQAGRLSQHRSLYIALETFQVVVRPLDGSGGAFCCITQRVLGEHDPHCLRDKGVHGYGGTFGAELPLYFPMERI